MYRGRLWVGEKVIGVYYLKENNSDAQITAVYLDGYGDNTYNFGTLKKIDSKYVKYTWNEEKYIYSTAFVCGKSIFDIITKRYR